MGKELDLIKHYEGLHDGDLKQIGLQPKTCPAGIWTEGYGHAMTDDKGAFLRASTVTQQQANALQTVHTEAEALALLDKDLLRYRQAVTAATRGRLSADQFSACVSLCYNIGIGSFQNSSVVKWILKGNMPAAGEAFMMWDKATVNGVRKSLPGLVARRRSERELFLYGAIKFFN